VDEVKTTDFIQLRYEPNVAEELLALLRKFGVPTSHITSFSLTYHRGLEDELDGWKLEVHRMEGFAGDPLQQPLDGWFSRSITKWTQHREPATPLLFPPRRKSESPEPLQIVTDVELGRAQIEKRWDEHEAAQGLKSWQESQAEPQADDRYRPLRSEAGGQSEDKAPYLGAPFKAISPTGGLSPVYCMDHDRMLNDRAECQFCGWHYLTRRGVPIADGGLGKPLDGADIPVGGWPLTRTRF
jgi:hypothetical protein